MLDSDSMFRCNFEKRKKQMVEGINKNCCFLGHREIDESENLKAEIRSIVSNLIENKGVDTFFFGSRSAFDSLCHLIVSDLKEIYPHIKRIYIRAEYSDINDDYRNYLLESYEDTYYPERIRNSGRASYVERNQQMINLCSVCVVYYNENYLPPRRRNSKRDLTDYQPKSGTHIAYDYAIKKKKTVINVYKAL